MSNFWQRAITGLFFVAVVVFAIIIGPLALSPLFALFGLVGYNEYAKIASRSFPSVNKVFGFLTVLFFHAVSFAVATDMTEPQTLWLLLPVIFMLPAVELFGKAENGIVRVWVALAGVVWVVLPFALLPLIGMVRGSYESEIVLGFFVLLWVNDTGAYLVGRSMGKHKLMPAVSPGKTIEGFVGGVMLSLAAAWGWYDFSEVLSLSDWLVMAFIVAVFSNAGDLVESLFKRNCGVKDSGNFLPGHGGVLDRFDGIMLSIPMILAYLSFTNH